ncbi:hypothetical protein [Saccharothrix luteola]|uniref:hypothetical protein n=1 Tax=Saccharothrix luteola TaxID=2893018 RepID=UPI001E31A013|nr:hypothetical protein [Saccharothrix luteola]MCC8246972.1 hypothetical protein [Saccharothrix luteola]
MFGDDEQAVGDFSPDGADEPLGLDVGSRTPWWDLHDLDAGVGEGRVERGGELTGPVADEEPEAVCPVAEVQQQVAGLLGGSGSVGFGADAEDVDVVGGDFHQEEDVHAFEGEGAVDLEEVAGQ